MKSKFPRKPELLAYLGLGIGIIGVAFTLRPPDGTPDLVFWPVLVLGILALLAGVKILVLDRFRNRASRRGTHLGQVRERVLVSLECHRYSDAVSSFASKQLSLKPRPWNLGSHRERLDRWRKEVKAAYRADLRTWGLATFDAAVCLDGIAPSSRTIVENPSPEQLNRLADLFSDAARSLEGGSPLPSVASLPLGEEQYER